MESPGMASKYVFYVKYYGVGPHKLKSKSIDDYDESKEEKKKNFVFKFNGEMFTTFPQFNYCSL